MKEIFIGYMMGLSKQRKHFDKSSQINAAKHGRLMTMILTSTKPYGGHEEEAIKQGVANFIAFAERRDATDLKMASPMTKAKCTKPGKSSAWGWAKGHVRAR